MKKRKSVAAKKVTSGARKTAAGRPASAGSGFNNVRRPHSSTLKRG